MNYKWWILVAILLFGIGIGIGLATPSSIASLLSEELTALAEFSGLLVPFKVSTMVLIFVRNAAAVILSFVFSPILCLLPVITLSLNGWLLAFLSNVVIEQKSLGFLLAGVLPHGIIELPALIIGEAAALSFGAMAIVALFQKDRSTLILSSLRQNSKYVLLAVALLLPAAIIETYVTPLLVT